FGRVERIFGGSRLVAIARTSGSAGEAKLVPVNRAYLASLDRTLRAMIATQLVTAGERDLLGGRHILIASRPVVGTAPSGLPVCDISGLAATRTPWPLRLLNIPRPRDLFIDDWPTKAERILEHARGKRVVSI